MINDTLHCTKCQDSKLIVSAGLDGDDNQGMDVSVYIECLNCGYITRVARVAKFGDVKLVF